MRQPVSRTFRIGVDLGGTKIEAIVLGPDGTIAARERVATPRAYAETLEGIVDVVHRVERTAGATGAPVGIGIPGAVTPSTGLVKNANSVWLIGQPLGSRPGGAARPRDPSRERRELFRDL